MLTTVRMVAPAPGRPPTKAHSMLPMPWPISSRLESWRVRVTESATSEVSRLSMLPSMPRVMPSTSTVVHISSEKLGSVSAGRPLGIGPITGTSKPASVDSAVIASRATSGAGTTRLMRIGVRNTITRVRRPSRTASPLMARSAAGSAMRAASGEGAGAAPSSGAHCRAMMMMPMPLMKPDTTG